ncbi:hypothetical protein MGG_12049 [Pyricularia oryzae 70-15]|uniref:Chitin-binding type-1 domain-containing protein n=3 Tax=Pyricularia oryzae TaxID=318829 RepID=G4NHN6_PYRO7|nr:uncharacterized protein MGG_12049 [Pyricularia oryzae 70-15]EHA47746.1 hypothetical protein MGG_12049 [Pyricularia oryzae 70-15]
MMRFAAISTILLGSLHGAIGAVLPAAVPAATSLGGAGNSGPWCGITGNQNEVTLTCATLPGSTAKACCSFANHCGTGPDYCGDGCQTAFGDCAPSTKTSINNFANLGTSVFSAHYPNVNAAPRIIAPVKPLGSSPGGLKPSP